jgi:hypothetical protein
MDIASAGDGAVFSPAKKKRCADEEGVERGLDTPPAARKRSVDGEASVRGPLALPRIGNLTDRKWPFTMRTWACVEGQQMFKTRLTTVLEQMMYVSGETAEPSLETTSMIEDIVRQQVIELVG